MKTNNKIFLALFVAVAVLSLVSPTHVAQGIQYQLLEKIPGTDGLGSDFPGYVLAIYKVAFVIVALSAVLMISIGGFLYLTSAGNTSSMSTAKGVIFDALIGLIIALVAWLVLNVINPDLVKIKLSYLPSITLPSADTGTSGGAVSPVGTGTPPTETDVDLANEILSNSNIRLNTTGDCSSPSGAVTPKKNIQDVASGKRMAACYAGRTCAREGSSGCADDAVRPSTTMLRAIVQVGAVQSFTITSISGGPHAGGPSDTHYLGRAIDVVPVSQTLLDLFVQNGAIAPHGNATSMCELNGINVGCNGGGANHMHIVFPN